MGVNVRGPRIVPIPEIRPRKTPQFHSWFVLLFPDARAIFFPSLTRNAELALKEGVRNKNNMGEKQYKKRYCVKYALQFNSQEMK